jgi:hypothetical protein
MSNLEMRSGSLDEYETGKQTRLRATELMPNEWYAIYIATDRSTKGEIPFVKAPSRIKAVTPLDAEHSVVEYEVFDNDLKVVMPDGLAVIVDGYMLSEDPASGHDNEGGYFQAPADSDPELQAIIAEAKVLPIA